MNSEKTSSTSKRLNLIMEREGLKQIDIIKKCEPYCNEYKIKIRRNDLSQYVSGKVNPGQSKLFILSKALNVNEAWLMGYDVPEQVDEEPNQKEDAISDIFTRLRKDTKFYEAVEKIYKLNDKQLEAVIVMISSFEQN